VNYEMISGDSHIDLSWLPADLFTTNAPRKLQDRVPRVVNGEEKRWVADGVDLGAVAGIGFRAQKIQDVKSRRVSRFLSTNFYDDAAKGLYHPTDAALRIRDQELDGIQAEVLYGILGVGLRLKDADLITTIYQTYNDWVAEFCKINPHRFAALACLPNHDPKAAALELQRAAKLGLKGADFAVETARSPIYHREWDALWETAAECRMPISFHSLGFSPRQPDPAEAKDYDLPFRAVRAAMFQLDGAEFLSSIIFSGACDRYPEFRFVLGECGISWIPYVLDRMDHVYQDRYHHLGLSLKPSEFWHRQGYTTYQKEDIASFSIPLAGEDNVLWGSDYPHPDSVWPDSKLITQQNLGQLEDRTRRKVTCENAGRLYGFLS
jgi:predicted TIM-barrel fold metal-dependent hydrolase